MRVLGNRAVWTVSIAACTLLALIEATAMHFDALRAERASNLLRLVFQRASADYVWVCVSVIVFAVMTRAMERESRARSIAGRFALLGIVLAPIYTTSHAIVGWMMSTGDPASLADRLRRIALTTFLWDGFLYVLVVLACYTVLLRQQANRQQREGAELRTRLAQAELELLRAQLEPHFLFNALNTVSGLIRAERHELATTAVAQLSELLRYVVDASRYERVPLAWELRFVRNYLELQQLRYGRRLAFAIHEDSVSRSCEVPPLLLQPLIENAVVHGAAHTSADANIEVRVTRHQAQLQVEVENSPARRPTSIETTTGVGLSNTRRRLAQAYGESFSLAAGPDGPESYRVSLSLPSEPPPQEPPP